MHFSTSTNPSVPIKHQNALKNSSNRRPWIDSGDLHQRIRKMSEDIQKRRRIHSSYTMSLAGFVYIDEGNTVCCRTCKLQVSGWTSDMDPFIVHQQRSLTCPFIQSKLSPSITITTSALCDEEPPCKKLKIGTTDMNIRVNILAEVSSLKEIRKRGFSHWSPQSSPSTSQMFDAGFFNCNVGDRVICIYCNLICQQWTPNSDDPYEVHKTLSPKCPYVIAMLTIAPTSSISVINEASGSTDSIRSQAIVHTAACNPNYSEILKRHASFAAWSNENLPPVDDLVRAGFFFTGTKTVVTCFYCNGSLQNWGANDNPMIEHARWFPHCAYAKQLCGVELHRKIQESKRVQQERERISNTDNRSAANIGNFNDGRLLIPDESTLSRFVAARLDLPISQRLLDQNFKLSVIRRCWEDQLRLKRDDFVDGCDLSMACTILQKQIECIDGKKENIIVPSLAMKQIREQAQRDVHARELPISRLSSSSINSSSNSDVEITTSSAGSDMNETDREASSATSMTARNYFNNAPNVDACERCMTNEWYSALLPCAHAHSNIFR